MVRALTSYQCGLGSIPIAWLSNYYVGRFDFFFGWFYSLLRRFFSGFYGFPTPLPPQKPTLLNSIVNPNATGLPVVKQSLFWVVFFFNFILLRSPNDCRGFAACACDSNVTLVVGYLCLRRFVCDGGKIMFSYS